ncbi:uncharacterized protein NECHADRAFT_106243 [Fusarium vanettenii 77-13-4]|uniref:Uncharacterized protein n=1 Tax=Fusarium vanettenii (strain ATCC MYA-4622 / CBS 123669 / FGSC 9596 / NRRL 45880 / 77-13-4) TaxID=660122 RepID=C7ZLM6_FUSV7|nr:uncharacterized protein NECHADRAFT_106243 [Fusarium vanettenii 77-13-4]EEU35090.1 hypothetical protein NECHADRAFT_106243 [Fusarium vanettenii 77-13-4]
MRLELKLKDTKHNIRLVLTPNDELTTSLTSVTILDPRGESRVSRPEHGSRAFKGSAHISEHGGPGWRRTGWARVVQSDRNSDIFQGTFQVDGDIYHIEVDPAHLVRRDIMDPKRACLVVRKSPDKSEHTDSGRLSGRAASCSTGNLGSGHLSEGKLLSRRQQYAQDYDPWDTVTEADETEGCPKERKVAMLGIATDCSYTAEFDSLADVQSNILNQINTVSQLYDDTFNIALRVMNLTISDRHCPVEAPHSAPWNLGCTSKENVADRLSLFSQWRARFNDDINEIRPAVWTLLTACSSESTVGMSWEGQVCELGYDKNEDGRIVAATNIVVRTQYEWKVIAHEIAHSFGAVHDCTSSMCKEDGWDGNERCCRLSRKTCDAGAQYLMNPSAKSDMKAFSPCTVIQICSKMGQGSVRTDCLLSEDDVPSISSKATHCGNGILEEGEDCDCGGASGCRSIEDSCCDPKTCRFVKKAVCDPLHHDCCTDQCQPASRGLVCRGSKGACDPEELCDGNSTTCPLDVIRPDGEACEEHGMANLACASGVCTSRDLQCQQRFPADNDTMKHCDSNSCKLNCRPVEEINENECPSEMEELLLDGTPCGDGLRCFNGKCENPKSERQAGSGTWFTKKRIIIIVCSVVGGFLVFVAIACVFNRIRHRMRRTAVKHARITSTDDSQ